MSPIGKGRTAAEHAAAIRRLVVEGKDRKALAGAWEAAQAALRDRDEAAMAAVRDLAEEIAGRSSGRAERHARQLASYCSHCLQGAGGGVRVDSIFARFFGARRRAKRCPDCAEAIDARARVCRFCGYRYEG